MDVKKIHELTGEIKYWQDLRSQAHSQLAQLEANIHTAEKEISVRERELRILLERELSK